MLFVRDKAGISHSPLEFVREADVAASVAALYMYLVDDVLASPSTQPSSLSSHPDHGEL
jgi:hypothetical protein